VTEFLLKFTDTAPISVVGKKLQTVAYLECAKEGGPGGLGEKLTLFCY